MAMREVSTEIWKPIPGHEGYEVSDLGRVRSLDRVVSVSYVSTRYSEPRHDTRNIKGRILKPKWDKARYAYVMLAGRVSFTIHQLVMMAFVGPCPPGLIVRHRDDDGFNNKLSNLCYGTRRQNHDDAVRLGKHARGERNHFAILTKAAVRSIRVSKDSYAVLAARYGVSKATILNVRNGRTWRWLDGDDTNRNIRPLTTRRNNYKRTRQDTYRAVAVAANDNRHDMPRPCG